MNPLLHRRCFAEGAELEAELERERRRTQFWIEEYRKARDEVWELQDKVTDRVPGWWALVAGLVMLWVGVWLGSL